MKAQPKFKMFDKVIALGCPIKFEITAIDFDDENKKFQYSSKSCDQYYDEDEIELYTEPKLKITLHEYLVNSGFYGEGYIILFFQNDETFKKFYKNDPIIKTGRSVEVEQ